jgi:hypothetical protein
LLPGLLPPAPGLLLWQEGILFLYRVVLARFVYEWDAIKDLQANNVTVRNFLEVLRQCSQVAMSNYRSGGNVFRDGFWA